MRPQAKLLSLGVCYLFGGVMLFAYGLMHLRDEVMISVALAWFVLFAILQFVLVRCNYCRWPLLLARKGRAIVPIGWVPAHCAKCGRRPA